ncbi:MAG: pyrroline-5-carboxylate reductase [Nitrosomonadales bacterium]|nr:pyrroline-5-carboxylate reductase [Nitrosomonadales bacterium]
MNICFIGGGNMATALIGGLLTRSYNPAQLRVVEINADNRTRLQQEFGVLATAELAGGIAGSEVIVLAVKPQQLRDVAAQLAPLLSGQLIISIAAGIRAADLARWLGTQNVARAMPNTPALIRSGITGLYALAGVTSIHKEIAENILNAVGGTVWLQEETMMDAITAVSGSGPAYFFYFIEALEQAGKELGLPEQTARKLALETAFGAAKLACESTEDPATLRARVTSKNGTTERALQSMEANHVKQHIITAAKAAAARSKEMGDELGGGS